MSLPRIVVDNSAVLPAYFPEDRATAFNPRTVNQRAESLVHAIRARRVNAFVPPSFFREFLNVATRPLDARSGHAAETREMIHAQWLDLLTLPLIVIPVREIAHVSGELFFNDQCPAPDTWYVAAAIHAKATLWVSHDHSDGLVRAASRHVAVRLLSREPVSY